MGRYSPSNLKHTGFLPSLHLTLFLKISLSKYQHLLKLDGGYVAFCTITACNFLYIWDTSQLKNNFSFLQEVLNHLWGKKWLPINSMLLFLRPKKCNLYALPFQAIRKSYECVNRWGNNLVSINGFQVIGLYVSSNIW